MKKMKKWMALLLVGMLCNVLPAGVLAEEIPNVPTQEPGVEAPAENTETDGSAPGVISETEAPALPEAEETTAPVPPAAEETQIPAPPVTEDMLPEDAEHIATLQDALNPDRYIYIYAVYEGETFRMGQDISLIAVLKGYENVTYTLQWQRNNGEGWQDVAGATGYQLNFTMDESAYNALWQIVVNITAAEVNEE